MSNALPYCYKRPHPAVAVDLVIFTLRDGQLQLLLVERGVEPFGGEWALPGGFVRIDEGLFTAAQRELREETGLSQAYLEQVGAFGRPDRDPRERVISVAFYAILSASKVSLQAGSDAAKVAWHSFPGIPQVAFDHAEIIDEARRKLVEKINRTTIAFEFLPPEFTLTELQHVFEAVRGEAIDKRNFRKWAESLVRPVGRMRRGGQHRPAALFRANPRVRAPIQDLTVDDGCRPGPARKDPEIEAGYRKGYEDALSEMHKAVVETERKLLRDVAKH